jgi:hypothetical protein
MHKHSVLEMQAVLHGEHLDALARRWSEQDTRGRTAMERTRVDPDLSPVRSDGEVESSNKDGGRRGIEYIDVEGRGRDKKCVTTEKDKIANVMRKVLAR